jgi:TPR repeat protein
MHRFFLPTALALAALGLQAATPIDDAVAAYQRGDLPRARTAFTRLSAQGSATADYNLAVMHLRREMPSSNDREAVRLMTRAAEAGFVTAMVGLAELHEQGRAGLAVDLPRSVQWQRRAAEAGSVDAQVALATAFYLGRGTPRDPALAARWYRVAAQGGDVGAMYLYASMVESGDGVERDLAEARYWYGAAARNGDEAAPGKVIEIDAKLAKPKPSI